MIMNGYEVRIW